MRAPFEGRCCWGRTRREKPLPQGSIGAPYSGTEAKLVGGSYAGKRELVLKNPNTKTHRHQGTKKAGEQNFI